VVAVSYDSPAILAAFSEQRGITFPLLSDADSKTIRAFGILNPAVEWGLGADKDDPMVVSQLRTYVSGTGRAAEMQRGMALPGTFVVDKQGRVTARYFEEFYVERQTSESVLLTVGAGTVPASATRVSSSQLDFTTYASDAAVAPGNRFSVVVDVVPRRGMHVYAPGADGYKPIALNLSPQPFVQFSPTRYPASEIYFFEPLNERVPIFQKPFRLVQEILIEGSADAQAALKGKESLTITGTVDYQACDDAICFNPVSVPVTWTVSLKDLIRERPTVTPETPTPPASGGRGR
jgi:peroxiredoxin